MMQNIRKYLQPRGVERGKLYFGSVNIPPLPDASNRGIPPDNYRDRVRA